MYNLGLAQRKLLNWLQTLLLIGGMALILALATELLIGGGVWVGVFAGVALSLAMFPQISPRWVLRAYQARMLAPQQAPPLYEALRVMAQRAHLPGVPELYWIPSNTLNAFAVGRKDDAAIALTDGLLRNLNLRELVGVIAHELSHISHNDMRLMALADLVSRMTHLITLFGMLFLFGLLPFILLGLVSISMSGIVLLFLAPALSALLQMSLSRTREFAADLEAVNLTGDPRGLASALAKLDPQRSYWQRLLGQGYRDPNPSVLRSHPQTEQRIQKLLSLKPGQQQWPLHRPDAFTSVPPELTVFSRPRQHFFSNIWR
ncbi:MAG: zinc metalloprotease HtpX [Chromatiales bacterium]